MWHRNRHCASPTSPRCLSYKVRSWFIRCSIAKANGGFVAMARGFPESLRFFFRSSAGDVASKSNWRIGGYKNLESATGLWWCLGCPWRRRPVRGLVGPGDGPRCPARRGRARGASGRRLEHRHTVGGCRASRSVPLMLESTSAALRTLSLANAHGVGALRPNSAIQACLNGENE